MNFLRVFSFSLLLLSNLQALRWLTSLYFKPFNLFRLATWFDDVASEVFLGFRLNGHLAFNRTELFELDFIRGVHSVFGRVIMAAPAGLAN